MTLVTPVEGGTTNYLRFVECCTGTEILFRGSLPIVNGQVYSYIGSTPFIGFGGNLEPGNCYTVYQEFTSDIITYPAAPTLGVLSLKESLGCEDPACPSCTPPSICQCPPGYVEIEPGICEGEESILPTPPESPLYVGNVIDTFTSYGLLSFGSINNYTWPILCTPQATDASSLSALTPIPGSGTNNITGDSWLSISPAAQPSGNHSAITTASPVPYPSPNPLGIPISAGFTRPYRESAINAGTLEYGQGNIIPHTGYTNTAFWQTWYNNTAVWQDSSGITNRYAGFNVCVQPTVQTTYQIVITGNNGYRIIIDDNLAVEAINGDGLTPSLAYANNFQVTLPAGTHSIRVECYNYSGNGGLGCEILTCTSAQLAAFTNLSQLVPYRVFSSLWRRKRVQTLTTNGTNIVTAVAGTQPYDLGGYFQMSGVDPNIYITNVIDANTYEVSQPIAAGVFSGFIRFIYNATNVLANSYTCPDGYTLINCDGLACVKTVAIDLVCDCYLIIPCDGTPTFVSNNIELASYINGFHTVISPEYTGCAYIIKLEDNECKDAVDAYVDPDLECECDLQCYYVSNSNGFLYVDENNELQEVTSLSAKPYIKVCSKIYPVVENTSTNYEIINLGLCENNECPLQCFKLTNCENPELVVYTTAVSLTPYVYGSNNIVRILNREGCWIASELDEGEICDCPVDVIITASYISCQDCIGYIAYRLTACEGTDVIYTMLNLEAYIGQVVKLNCGCYEVEQINYLPPNPQVIKLEDIYANCIECARSYWKLIDCAGEATPIITYTDLSLYEKQVVKIENCEECWIVESTQEHLNATTVVVTESHVDCETCGINLPCECTIVTNYGECNRTYGYLDCDNTYHEFTLIPGESSDRVCAKKWYIIPFCDCFLVKISIETAPGQFVSQVYTATATDQVLNCYPVYTLCLGDRCGTVSFNGTDWVIYDAQGVALYKLIPTSNACVYGRWVTMDGQPIPSTQIESYACPNVCTCVNISVTDPEGNVEVIQFLYYGQGKTGSIYNNPTYGDLIYNSQIGCWLTVLNVGTVAFCEDSQCPIGVGVMADPIDGYTITSEECPPAVSDAFLPTDFFQTFGECQNGVCLPPTFKNNRTVKPGYNTPGCNPDEYDKITCKFSEVMYKIVLEKRYGITNCCPEDDEKWLLKKELIDLQALKDPNYKCPSCPCSCNSGKTYSTCNCGN